MIKLMVRKTSQSGFLTLPIIILISILLTVGVVTVVYKSKLTNQPASQNAQEASSSSSPQQSVSPTPEIKKISPSPIRIKTSTPKPSPTTAPIPTRSPDPTSTPAPTLIPTATPTPTPRPKPICSILIMPTSSGTAPYDASFCVGNNSNPFQAVQKEFVDYDGNGSWDYEGAQYGCHAYTFQSPGTYSPKAKIIGSSGDESDTCQTTVTVN